MHQTIRWERNRVSEIGTRLLIKAGFLNYGKRRNCEMINYQGMRGMPVSVYMTRTAVRAVRAISSSIARFSQQLNSSSAKRSAW